jgi:phosphatidylinositol 4-kinase
MDKVMMLIWQFRDDASVVQFMAQFVTKYAGHRDVFDGIEFYLPQLAHMIIHLEANWDDAILERFALIIAQHSIHFALQLNWILQGAIEDYQPELPNGEPNANFHVLYYTRCVKLLANIERCVVYGTPRTHELQRLYEKGQITKEEYEIMEQADRRYNATQLTSAQNELLKAGTFGGNLLYKRVVRTSHCSRKAWKTRYFEVSERMLYCYNVHPSAGGRLLRAMPLEGAVISETSNPKYPHMFEVQNLNYLFRMRAADNDERARWIRVLQEEIESHTLYPHQVADGVTTGHSQKQFMQDLTASQKARYDFFKNQRDYLRNLTNIAEKLRFEEREERKALAPGYVRELGTPSCVYIPLCNSTDIWRRVQTTFAKETRVFNTNERCPVVMYFLTKRGEHTPLPSPNLDVAEYLKLQYEVPDVSLNPIAEEESDNFEVIDNSGDLLIIRSEDEMKHSSHMLWTDEESESADQLWSKGSKEESEYGIGKLNTPENSKGNAQLKNFLRENFVRIPSKIKARLPQRAKRPMMASGILPLQSMPILENGTGEDEEDKSIVSEVSGSMLTAEGGMVAPIEKDGIDDESLQRAYKFICHGEPWIAKSERMLRESLAEGVIDNSATTEVNGIMVKSNDDLRQEVFVMQMIHYYKSVFVNASLPIWLRTYRILSTSKDTGIIEFLIDSTSMDGLKKTEGYPLEGGLRAYFENTYGSSDGKSFKAAQRNFMLSLVGYSLVSYLLGLKDRHNGNIMIDVRGRLIHIDFGFAMGMAPGHEFSFERAPFKMTQDYIDVMGGSKAECFAEFKRLFVAGFEAARKNSQIALGLVEIMMYKSNYPCFSGPRYGGRKGIIGFKRRLMLTTPDNEIRSKVLGLIQQSIDSTGTWIYDRFQLMSNGYAM